MRHFKIYIIGENINEQLLPYHQYEYTDYNNQYVVDIDITKEVIKEFESTITNKSDIIDINNLTNELKTLYHEELEKFIKTDYDLSLLPIINPNIDIIEEFKYGYYCKDNNGFISKIIKRTNPNYKWDWYEIGGRWENEFLLNDGSFTNSAKRGLIDFEQMLKYSKQYCAELWDKVQQITEGKKWDSLNEIIKRVILTLPDMPGNIKLNNTIVITKHEYLKQPIVNKIHDSNISNNGIYIDDYLLDKEVFINKHQYYKISPFASIIDGKWIEHDKDIPEVDWNKQIFDILTSLNDDVLITVIDCHI